MTYSYGSCGRRRLLQHVLRGSALAATGVLPWQFALGQAPYPNRPVRIINPFPAGSPYDVVARFAADKLNRAFGQPFIVENRTGVGGTLGTGEAAHASGDGYTLLVQATSMLSTTSLLYKSLSYDLMKDLLPIWSLQGSGFVLVINPKLPIKSAREFIEYAKASPGKVTFGTPGNGTIHHLSAEVFMANTGTKMLHVPYRGAVPAETDLMAGHIDCIFDSLNGVLSMIQAGRLRALGVLRSDRASVIPDVPTMREVGVPNMEPPLSCIGLFAPSGLPAELRARLIAALNDSLADPRTKAQLAQMGMEKVVAGDEVRQQLVRERQFYGPLIAASGITLD